VLDSDGRAGDIYMDPDTAYKFVLTKSDDSAVWTADNIYAGGQVDAGNVGDGAVSTTAKIADGIITGAKTTAGEGFVYVSSNDTTGGVLNGKLAAGDGITLTEGNDGADETLTVAISKIDDLQLSNTAVASTTDETDLKTYTIPGGTLSVGDVVRVEAYITAGAVTTTSAIKFYFGTDVSTVETFTSSGDDMCFRATIGVAGAAVQRTIFSSVGRVGGADSVVVASSDSTEAISGDIVVKFTATHDNTSNITTQLFMSVERAF
jgi:hypothetical protein